MKHAILAMTASLVAAVSLTGCTTIVETFADEDPAHVWTALVAVAQTPDYSDDDPDERWTVKENHVFVDEANARIEIYRELDRVLHRARTNPVRQERTWKFQILFEPEPPPTAIFTSRRLGVPMQAADEAERFFADVWELLGGRERAAPRTPRPSPPPQPAEEEPPVDIEEIDAGGG